jgi:TolA-binding protein
MSEARGSSAQARDKANSATGRKRDSVVSEELQSAIGAQVQSALAKVLEQFGSQFKQVQGALSALGDRLEGLEHLV